MKCRAIFKLFAAVVLPLACLSLFAASASAGEVLKDYAPRVGKVMSAPASWQSTWAKKDGVAKWYELVKTSMAAPPDDSVLRERYAGMVETADLFVFGPGDDAPLMLGVVESSVQEL